MVETKEAKAFPRIAWEKMFDKKGNPLLPKHNWKFLEYIPSPGVDDYLLPEITGGSELQAVIAAKAAAEAKAKQTSTEPKSKQEYEKS